MGINEDFKRDVQDFLTQNNVMAIPRISNTDENGNWFGQAFLDLINDSGNRVKLEQLILDTLKKYNLKGINIDVESISGYNMENYYKFLNELSVLMHSNNLYLTVDVPINNSSFNYGEIGSISDLIFVMAHDEHYDTGTAGPVASQEWFNDGVLALAQVIPKDKMIVDAGQYAQYGCCKRSIN